MTTTACRLEHLFVVRMWQEADAVTATVQWHGWVKHPLSDACHYFTRLPDLLAFIADSIEDGQPAPVMHSAATINQEAR